MVKTMNKYDNLSKAVKRLNEANIRYKKSADDPIYQDALIKRFEFTFELAWKTLRQFMMDSGYQMPSVTPKGVFAYAYQESILQDEKIWLDMLEDRNLSTHDYGFEMAKDIADRISNKYAKCLAALAKYVGDAI